MSAEPFLHHMMVEVKAPPSTPYSQEDASTTIAQLLYNGVSAAHLCAPGASVTTDTW